MNSGLSDSQPFYFLSCSFLRLLPMNLPPESGHPLKRAKILFLPETSFAWPSEFSPQWGEGARSYRLTLMPKGQLLVSFPAAWELQIGRGGTVCITEIVQQYKSELFVFIFWKSSCQIFASTTPSSSKIWTYTHWRCIYSFQDYSSHTQAPSPNYIIWTSPGGGFYSSASVSSQKTQGRGTGGHQCALGWQVEVREMGADSLYDVISNHFQVVLLLL